MAQIASEIIDVYSIVDGLNTIKAGVRVGPSELKDCQNIRYFPVGGFKWRQGYETIGNSTGYAATGLYMMRLSSGTNILLRTQNTKLEKMDALDGTWDDITGVLTLTAGQNNLFTFATLNDITVATNNVDTCVLVAADLSVSHLSSTVTTALFVVEHRGYMFYGNCVVSGIRYPGRIYFSDLNTPGTIGANNYIEVAGKTGGDLRGAVDYQGKNFCFKRHGIFSIEFQPTRVNTAGDLFPFIENVNPVVPGVGTQSHRSIVKFTTPSTHKTPGQELVFFVDQFGMPRLFDGSSTISIGTPLMDSRDEDIKSLSDMNRSRLPYIWAVNDSNKNLIYCHMSGLNQSQHDVCWVLDYTTGFAWSRDEYADTFNCGALVEETTGLFKPYFGTYTGQIMEMDSTQTDNGVAIYSYARTGDLYMKSPVVNAKWLYNEIRGATGGETQIVNLDYYVNGDDSPSVTSSIILFKQTQAKWDDNFLWDENNWVYSGLTTKSSEINTEAKTLSVRFWNRTSGNTAAVEGCSLFVLPEGWKQED